MGRKERRAKERQERKESIRMTPDRIYELKQKTANEAVRRVQEIEKGKEKQRGGDCSGHASPVWYDIPT
jgi:hypothetical protein